MNTPLIVAHAAALVVFLVPAILLGAWLHNRNQQINWNALAAFTLAYLAHILVLALPQLPPFETLRFNWQNKVLVAALLAGFFAACPIEFRKLAGFTRPNGPWIIPALIGTVTLVILGVFAGLMAGPQRPLTSETILFQALVPGFDEELLYRGLLWALLVKAYDLKSRGSQWIALVFTTLLFSLVHSVVWLDGSISFNFAPFLATFVVGFWLAWTRLYTGSIVLPIILHNVYNVLFNLIAAG